MISEKIKSFSKSHFKIMKKKKKIKCLFFKIKEYFTKKLFQEKPKMIFIFDTLIKNILNI